MTTHVVDYDVIVSDSTFHLVQAVKDFMQTRRMMSQVWEPLGSPTWHGPRVEQAMIQVTGS